MTGVQAVFHAATLHKPHASRLSASDGRACVPTMPEPKIKLRFSAWGEGSLVKAWQRDVSVNVRAIS
jgi:hypothetical protein